MRLGLNVGYWGLGMGAADQLELVKEAEGAGFDSVWAAEAYGSDAATVLAWLAAQTERIRIGSAIFQMPGSLARDDRHDRGHARPALRRADAARDRHVRAAGGRGLARAALRQAARAHARVRGDPAQDARARAARVRRRDLSAAAPRRARQGAEAHDRAGAGADPDLHRLDRAEEHAAHRRDRRRLAADLLLPRARGRVARRCSRRAPRGPAGRSGRSSTSRRA